MSKLTLGLGNMSPALKNKAYRADSLKAVRAFFDARGVMEVDTPILSEFAPIDTHIDIFEVIMSESKRGYLHSSPEYAMKKLLAEGVGDIYQLGHVYRKGESGRFHRPEFTMIEWYRIGTTFQEFLQENLDLVELFLGKQPVELLTYREACARHAAGIEGDRHLIWATVVEPQFPKDCVTVVTHFPKEDAALARTTVLDGEEVAERFEIYYQGIELGNGYHELTDPVEQKRRLEEQNRQRLALGKEALPIDPELIAALEKGLPDCYGIALGFDRLLMLKHGVTNILNI